MVAVFAHTGGPYTQCHTCILSTISLRPVEGFLVLLILVPLYWDRQRLFQILMGL